MIRATKRLHVLMVTPHYLPQMGGAETHVYEVGRRLVSSGVDLTVLTTAPQHWHLSIPREEIIEGMQVIRVRAWPSQPDGFLAPEIYSVVKNGKWDLVHCQGCHTFVPPLAMLAAKRARMPYVVTFHSGGHSSWLRNSIRSLHWKLLYPLLADASKLITVSRFETDYFRTLLGLPVQHFATIPNGADLPIPIQAASRTVTSTLIASVGRLERYKGHHRLIMALPKIHETLPDARLLILGTGPYEASLRKLAQKRGVAHRVEIRAVSTGDRYALAEQLSQAALVALLSEYESQGIAVMEALSLQRPVLVADTSALREFARQKLVQAVSLSSSPEEIAAHVLRQIERPLSPKQFIWPTWEDCTQKLLDTYYVAVGREQCVSSC